MNFLGRVYLLLITVLLVVLLTIFLLSPQTVGDWAGNVSEVSPILRIVVAALLDAVLLSLLFVQVRPARRGASAGLMMRASGAVTEVSVESARERILKAVSDVSDVVSAEARVTPLRGKADLELDIEVLGEDIRLPNKQKEINRALKQVINKQLGLQMAGRPRVHIRLYGEKPRPTALPPAVTPPPAPPEPPAEPERKESAGLFAGLRHKPAPDDEPTLVEKPAPVPEKPAVEETPERKEPTGILGGLFQRQQPAEAETEKAPPAAKGEESDDDEMFADTPELAVLLRQTKRAGTPAGGAEQDETDQPEIEETDTDTLMLDADEAAVKPAADMREDAEADESADESEDPRSS
ncbi:MAG: hypothetical protein HXY41_02180 [Chloroflexi bacterium]|nr:hypothetical protein [Chloroflexota bacterium]